MYAHTQTAASYNPARGGHAPSHIRQAFRDALDAYFTWEDGAPEPTVIVRGVETPISRVCGLVWNCTDKMPHTSVDDARDLLSWVEAGRNVTTYGRAARMLRSKVEEALRPA
ncbi:hypothetical protein [Salinarimonas soli]|uniref:Uncharacterized protein n=1 Tax=Salinarimonas soli TaxID=1638099 RepID=A0A5B2VDE3_9HYPH|nr:hypothetical protein [Salinarimonas soli]KAA2236964.1 hypothetical protein F0L46_11875 [Salinarimonas soli]